ncbi:hypothetical protein Dimus_033978, partial [Dionaea muscipula]
VKLHLHASLLHNRRILRREIGSLFENPTKILVVVPSKALFYFIPPPFNRWQRRNRRLAVVLTWNRRQQAHFSLTLTREDPKKSTDIAGSKEGNKPILFFITVDFSI